MSATKDERGNVGRAIDGQWRFVNYLGWGWNNGVLGVWSLAKADSKMLIEKSENLSLLWYVILTLRTDWFLVLLRTVMHNCWKARTNAFRILQVWEAANPKESTKSVKTVRAATEHGPAVRCMWSSFLTRRRKPLHHFWKNERPVSFHDLNAKGESIGIRFQMHANERHTPVFDPCNSKGHLS